MLVGICVSNFKIMNSAAVNSFEHVSGCTDSGVSLSYILIVHQMYISARFGNQYSTKVEVKC